MSKNGIVSFENVKFHPFRGEQTSSERSFAGFLTCAIVCAGALPGGGDLVMEVRKTRVTMFHNEDNDNVALKFFADKWYADTDTDGKPCNERFTSIVRVDDATYAYLVKAIPEIPEVKRHLLTLYKHK